MGIRGELVTKKEEGGEKEEIIIGRAKYGGGSIRVVRVYVNNDIEEKLKEIGKWIEEKQEGIKTIIGGILMRERKGS